MKTSGQRYREKTHARIQVERNLSTSVGAHGRNQFIDQVAIHLEKSPGPDAVLRISYPVSNFRSSGLRQWLQIRWLFLLRPASRRKKGHSRNRRHFPTNRLGPAQQRFPVGVASAERPHQQPLIACIGEEFNFFDPRRASTTLQLDKPRHQSVDKRRTDRALSHRQKFVRPKTVVSQSELRRGSHLKPRAVAVIPRRRRM